MVSINEEETLYSNNGKMWSDVTHMGDRFLFEQLGEISVMHFDKTTEEIETPDELLEAIENNRKIVIEK